MIRLDFRSEASSGIGAEPPNRKGMTSEARNMFKVGCLATLLEVIRLDFRSDKVGFLKE